MSNPDNVTQVLLRISEALAIVALVCSLIPETYGVGFAISSSRHIVI
jgi:hypothetical protein